MIIESVNAVMYIETGKILECWHLIKHQKYKEVRNKSAANASGRLAQGVGDQIKGPNTIELTWKQDIHEIDTKT